MAGAPTLTEVKDYLRIGHADHDDLLLTLRTTAQDWAEEYTGLRLDAADVTEYVDGGGKNLWPQERLPVNSVTSVTDRLSDAEEPTTNYFLYDDGIYRKWGSRWAEGQGRWKVIYNGGGPARANALRGVLLTLIARGYESRGDLQSLTEGDVSMNWREIAGGDIIAQLRTFRRGLP